MKHAYFTSEDMRKQRAGIFDLTAQFRRQLGGGFNNMKDYPHLIELEIDDATGRTGIDLDRSLFVLRPEVARILTKLELNGRKEQKEADSNDDKTDGEDEEWRPIKLRAERRFMQSFKCELSF